MISYFYPFSFFHNVFFKIYSFILMIKIHLTTFTNLELLNSKLSMFHSVDIHSLVLIHQSLYSCVFRFYSACVSSKVPVDLSLFSLHNHQIIHFIMDISLLKEQYCHLVSFSILYLATHTFQCIGMGP